MHGALMFDEMRSAPGGWPSLDVFSHGCLLPLIVFPSRHAMRYAIMIIKSGGEMQVGFDFDFDPYAAGS